MSTNPWVTVHATAAPARQARALRLMWEGFLTDGSLDQVRAPIAESWRRSEFAGFSPSRSRAPTVLPDRRDVGTRWEAHSLAAVVPLVRRWLAPLADASNQLIVVSDVDGLLLWLDGDARVRSWAADEVNFVEGAVWDETGAGTNAIGTALATDHPVQVHAAEHFSEVVHGWTCSAAPIHDPEDGRLLGIIDLTGRAADAHPRSVGAVLAAARAVEAELRVGMQGRDARLRAQYLERMTSSRSQLALVSPSGRVIADHPDGFLRAASVDVPAAGGVITLTDGRSVVAEPLAREVGYILRPLDVDRRRRWRARASRSVAHHRDDIDYWRRSQLELSRLAEEQAALRRVATLVAGQATANEIFGTVAEEVARLLRADRGTVCRYEEDGAMTVAAFWDRGGHMLPDGVRLEPDGDGVAAMVQQLGRPARRDSYEGVPGSLIELAASLGAPQSTVGAPILAQGRVWGAILVTSTKPEPFPDDTESRLMGFAELAATAISNAVARDELQASRARIVASADQTRRRIERDLHDGAQQRLVTLALDLRSAAASDEEANVDELRKELARAADAVAGVLDELHEISRGLHPVILSEHGVEAALRALSRRCALPVELDVAISERLPERVEVAGYYIVSELLTNAVKHAHASAVRVSIEQRDATLRLSIRDDGVGGADPGAGSGLTGLRDRAEAIGGTISVESPVGAGTTVLVSLPLV